MAVVRGRALMKKGKKKKKSGTQSKALNKTNKQTLAGWPKRLSL